MTAGIKMSWTVLVLLLLSIGTGFALRAFSWFVVVVPWIVLALLSAAILHAEGYEAVSGIACITACLTLSQIVYVAEHTIGAQ
jgi:hypothetical protein